MLLAILSDSHDNTENITKALALLTQRGITDGLHLGDFTSPHSVKMLADSDITWKCVWGNMDIDKELACQLLAHSHNVDIAPEDFRELEIGGKKLFLTHYPQIARIAALTGTYDAAFHGHTHLAAQEIIKNPKGPIQETLLANPGELCGYRYGKPSLGLYDTENGSFEHLPV